VLRNLLAVKDNPQVTLLKPLHKNAAGRFARLRYPLRIYYRRIANIDIKNNLVKGINELKALERRTWHQLFIRGKTTHCPFIERNYHCYRKQENGLKTIQSDPFELILNDKPSKRMNEKKEIIAILEKIINDFSTDNLVRLFRNKTTKFRLLETPVPENQFFTDGLLLGEFECGNSQDFICSVLYFQGPSTFNRALRQKSPIRSGKENSKTGNTLCRWFFYFLR
jgi:hypothetical protein